MSYYAYFDRDYFINSGDYPLSGDHYKSLLRHCFAYTSHVSFLLRDSVSSLLGPLEKWKVFSTVANSNNRSVYKTSNEVFSAMCSWTDSLFELYTPDKQVCPEDPIFYREDGSIFCEAITHEGECNIFPRNDENVDNLLGYGHWLLMNEDGTPNVPAKEHLLPFPTTDEILSDPLYQDLMRIYKEPMSYLASQSINEICMHIKEYRPPILRNTKKALPSFISCVPKWYQAFEMFVLSECNSRTGTDIQTAILQADFEEVDGFNKFYLFLDKFVTLAAKHQ